MKNLFVSLLVFLLWSVLGLWWYYSCEWCNAVPLENNAPALNTIVIDEKPEVLLNSSNKPEILSETLQAFLITDEMGETVYEFDSPSFNSWSEIKSSFILLKFKN